MFKFADNLELVADMMENVIIRRHANLVVDSLDKIILLLANASFNQQEKQNLVELGQRHYHFGLKIEHLKVNFIL